MEKGLTIQKLVHNEDFIAKAQDMLGEGTQQFLTSVLTLANSNKLLADCDPVKLYNCCLMAAAVKLPFNQNLGQAYIVPFKGEPQLQIGWKGFVQLAQRSGLYKTISCTDVRDGEIDEYDRLSGDMSFDWIQDEDERAKKPVIGYVAYFKLLNGYEQTFYMSMKELEKHAKRYSQTYAKGFGVWKDNFDAMAKKTVIKLMLSKFGPLSVDMQKALDFDQANSDGKYPDNGAVEIVEAEIGSSEEERSKGDA